ncbi:MAG: hypothetical protein QXX35_02825 [Desulfurococcaceae archaeon]
MKKSILLRKIYLTAVIIIVISIIYVVLENYFTNKSIGFEVDENVYYIKTLNYSNVLLKCIVDKKPCYLVDPRDLYRTHGFIKRRFNEFLNTRGIDYYTLARLETYFNISFVNNKLYFISIDLSSAWSIVLKTSDELELLAIDSALNMFRNNRLLFERLLRDLDSVITTLENTKYSIYISSEYIPVYTQLSYVSRNMYELILEYYELMNILDSNREELYKPDGLRNTTLLILSEIDVSKLDVLSIKISNFITQLKSISEAGMGLTPGDHTAIPSAQGVPYD